MKTFILIALRLPALCLVWCASKRLRRERPWKVALPRTMRANPSFVFIALAVLAVSALAQDRYAQRLDPAIEQVVKDEKIPGLAVGIVQGGRLVYSRGFGVMKLGEPNPVTPETLFHMASITKPFVATAIMQLVEQGKVDLDAPVTKYLPYFRLKDPWYKSITVRHMLTHTSGMPDVDDYLWNKPEYDDGALERYVRSLADKKLRFDPGTKFAYSNMAYEVLGDLVAKVAGVSVEDYVDEHILKPLGMTSSTLLIKNADPSKLAAGHSLGKKKIPKVIEFYPYNRAHTPSSNLHSNVVDMARWAMANMNRGELDGHRILQSSTYDVLWKSAVPPGRNQPNVGISWFLSQMDGEQAVMHDGGDDGFMTMLEMIPARKFALLFMANCDYMTERLYLRIVETAVPLSK
jgi:CubicO group peptidase (beta-lactamase class C family)